jgi:hypothetical protein
LFIQGEITFQNNQAEINIDELPVEKMVDSNHGGTVKYSNKIFNKKFKIFILENA